MLAVYHLSASRSERIIWLMEELGEPYELVQFERTKSRRAPDSMLEIHDLPRAPIIKDKGFTLVESGAIMEYILSEYGNGRLVPEVGTIDYMRYLQWMHFSEGSLMFQVILSRIAAGDFGGEKMAMADMLNERAISLFKFIDKELAKTTYFAGDEFSAADIMMVYSLNWLKRMELTDSFPAIQKYLGLIGERPVFQKAMAIANP